MGNTKEELKDLLPCPFCAGTDLWIGTDYEACGSPSQWTNNGYKWEVSCLNNQCCSGVYRGKSRSDIMQKWNNRNLKYTEI